MPTPHDDGYRPGFIFWTLAPCLVLFMALMPFLIPEWNVQRAILMAAIEALCLLVFLGLMSPITRWWTWRGVGAIIFLAYVAYVIAMFREGGGEVTVGSRRSQPSVLNALLGFVAFGVPGLMYAVLGRFTLRDEDEGEAEPDDDEWD